MDNRQTEQQINEKLTQILDRMTLTPRQRKKYALIIISAILLDIAVTAFVILQTN